MPSLTDAQNKMFFDHFWFVIIAATCNGLLKLCYDVYRTILRQTNSLFFLFRQAYITIAIRLRYDYDEKLTCSVLLASNRVKWKQAPAIRRSRIVVESQL